ncbi:MAG TPA: carboxypeptidase-like regulatory domain-containing protein, partial [Polyangiaceae bacterium]|nr:carboxypeptidase-like regulatory domain-containing protein [Polyangiaceae bacterium]
MFDVRAWLVMGSGWMLAGYLAFRGTPSQPPRADAHVCAGPSLELTAQARVVSRATRVSAPSDDDGLAPDRIQIRVRSSSGAALPGASLVLRSAGSERQPPRELDSGVTTDRAGLASLDPELLSELTDDEQAELLVQAEGFGSVLVNEEALLSALGRDAPYLVELAPLSRFTLVSQCPAAEERQLIMGWFRDDGLELERQYADCAPQVELEVDAPRGRVHFVALLFDEDTPQLALRTLELDSETSGTAARVELPLRPYPLSLRALQVVDRRDRPIPELEVLAANQLGRDAQLDRWLNDGSTYTDAEGRFEWLTQRSRAAQLLLGAPAPRPRVSHTLR